MFLTQAPRQARGARFCSQIKDLGKNSGCGTGIRTPIFAFRERRAALTPSRNVVHRITKKYHLFKAKCSILYVLSLSLNYEITVVSYRRRCFVPFISVSLVLFRPKRSGVVCGVMGAFYSFSWRFYEYSKII